MEPDSRWNLRETIEIEYLPDKWIDDVAVVQRCLYLKVGDVWWWLWCGDGLESGLSVLTRQLTRQST
jgi:hypothetical protein